MTPRVVLERCRDLPTRTFAPGEVIIAEGTTTGVLYILASGSIEVVKNDTQINTVSEPGAFFGEVSLLLEAPHTATVRAIDTAMFHVADDPHTLLTSRPELALGLARLLARRLHFVTTYLVDLKRQFEDHGGHLSMVDDVLGSLVHHQEPDTSAGSDRCPDPTVE